MNQANPVRTDLAHLRTEARNPRTLHIDTLPTPDMVRLMCEENRVVEDAVAAQADAIAAAKEDGSFDQYVLTANELASGDIIEGLVDENGEAVQ